MKRFKLSEEAKKLKQEKDKVKIANYRSLTDEVLNHRQNGELDNKLFQKTTKLLHLNPEFYTVWNVRREVMANLFKNNEFDKKESLEYELSFVTSLLKRFPKCYWIWNHRIWCLFQFLGVNEAKWEAELLVCSKFLSMDSRNFLVWQYRRFIVDNIEKDTFKTNEAYSEKLLLYLKVNITEYNFAKSKINNNISNFSAWHNLTKLIPKIYNTLRKLDCESPWTEINSTFSSPRSILSHELELVKTGMYMDADDTSVWLYHRWLLSDQFFVSDLKAQEKGIESYISLLEKQLNTVLEVNELEKLDNGKENCWCLKTMVFIKTLIKREVLGDSGVPEKDTVSLLQKLIEIDSLRRGLYLDQLKGLAPII